MFGALACGTVFTLRLVPTRRCGFDQVLFADDLNVFRTYDNDVSLNFLMVQLQHCQREVHLWGKADGESFERSKESFHVLSHVHFYGDPFRLLGMIFDLQFSMCVGVSECVHECHWRLSNVLCARRYFSLVDLVLQYNS